MERKKAVREFVKNPNPTNWQRYQEKVIEVKEVERKKIENLLKIPIQLTGKDIKKK